MSNDLDFAGDLGKNSLVPITNGTGMDGDGKGHGGDSVEFAGSGDRDVSMGAPGSLFDSGKTPGKGDVQFTGDGENDVKG